MTDKNDDEPIIEEASNKKVLSTLLYKIDPEMEYFPKNYG